MLEKQIERLENSRMYNRSLIGIVARAAAYAVLAIGSAFYVMGCDENGEGTSPTARLSVSSPIGEKPHNGVILDASASSPGSSQIIKADFDFDGDGTHDYTETASNAPDGSFDLMTIASYPNEGDFTPAVTITNEEWLEDSAFGDVDVGYGNDSAGAYTQAEEVLSGAGYLCTQNQDFQLFNPLTTQMTAYTGLKAELSDTIIYVIYDWNSLTNEQKDTINTRASQGMDDPQVVILGRTDSPDTIDSILAGY